MLFTAVFDDNSKYCGGTLQEPKWLDIPLDKKIRTIFYTLPFNDCLGMSGYDAYYHFGEIPFDITGKNKGKKTIEHTYLIGKKGNKYLINKISWINGNVERKIVDNTDKLISELNSLGWRNGV